ncbi:uncharacterized protein [Drosophila virilis]|uniref:Uncharacterized protein n=1 Tax=Drosophila virilis TaxID=7244 RepID=B4M6W4_DROVI|nr:uncharacterized protein LOC6633834 [Drosophila virilis]EDW62531.1 uncharacterized protein Dvir_GJ16564 [Drosophila virilis]
MKLLNAVILGLAVVSLTFQDVNASCELQINSPKPLILTHFGSKHLVSETDSTLIRDNYETVDLYCAYGFQTNSHNYGTYEHKTNHVKLTCDSSRFWFENARSSQMYIYQLQCLGNQVSNMYESRMPMPDCNGYMSLVVGQSFGSLGSLKTAAMCYDIVKQQLKYVSYTAYPQKIKVLEKTQAGQLNELGLDIGVTFSKSLFKPFSDLIINEAFSKDKQLKALFGQETFEYTNLIQDEAFTRDLSAFKEMLSIVWLRALRTGNWRHLLNALQTASINAKYDVRVGVSGVVGLPMLQSCNESRTLTIELDSGDTLSVPAHIWAHVRALEPTVNGTDEVVVVAHNSPFLTSNERDGLCKSICHEVSWLKNSLFSKLQQYPVYGLVQCCRVEDVQEKLENFPKRIEPPQLLPWLGEPAEELETTTESNVNKEFEN